MTKGNSQPYYLLSLSTQAVPEATFTGEVLVRHNSVSLYMAIDFERQQFFFSRTRREGDHLIWDGANVKRGYGKMMIVGENVYTHRVSWCIAHNLDLRDIEDKTIIRTCDRNDCVEPTHLAAKQKKGR